MKEIVSLLERLEKETSTNAKEEILRENRENVLLRNVFLYALDPNKKFGFRRFELFSIPKHRDDGAGDGFVFSCLDRLLEDKKSLKTFIPNVTAEMSFFEQDVFTRILKKDLSCGVSVGLAKRVWTDLFPDAPKLCKAFPFSEKNLKKIVFPACAQIKADGERVLLFLPKEGAPSLLSGNGNVFWGLSRIEEALETIRRNHPLEKDLVLDGELLHRTEEGKIADRATGNGILTKSIKGTISKEEQESLLVVVWDVISLEDYQKGVSEVPYEKRLELLRTLVSGSDVISLIESRSVSDLPETFSYFIEARERGEEGIILKNLADAWEGKRIRGSVKFKLEISNTLRCLEQRPGKPGTKYETCLGSLVCASDDKTVEVMVGGGFSDEQREFFWKNPLVGKCVEIVSNGLIQDKDGTYSLFLPRFKMVRDDKNETDDFQTILELSKSSEIISLRTQNR